MSIRFLQQRRYSPAAERLGGLVKFQRERHLRIGVADGIPMKLPVGSRMAQVPLTRKSRTAAVKSHELRPRSPTPSRYVVTLVWTEHRLCMNVFENVS